MPESPISKTEFLTDLNAIVEKNISNETFGVSELADAMNMSRSNLLRKVKKETGLSVTQLISQVRLNRAMELLRSTSSNVSEVSHLVGFNSTSYFIKCFREYYGFPPGEAAKRNAEEIAVVQQNIVAPGNRKRKWLVPAAACLVVVAALVGYLVWPSTKKIHAERSIAVLPFKNDSNDSTNVYLINGLMESTINNLQQIKELKVISRTSSEKYRNTTKSIPEIAKELGVNYFVEGSGQKIGDRIVLNIQLIDASSDRHLWAKQYRRETREIFELQQEIAKNIAEEIEVIVTPDEEKRIDKKPTDDLVAYDYFLKGKDLFYRSGPGDLLASIPWFQKAIAQDPEFSLAYATAAMVYYYLDLFQAEKKYQKELSAYADKAMLYDPKSGESLVAKALDYASKKEYQQSVPYFEKALEFNPHSALVLHFLNEFYSIYVPNPRKHLTYAIKKVKLDLASADSATKGFNYFHLSSALFETGFEKESITYLDKSLAFDPNGYFLFYGVYFRNMRGNDLVKMKEELIKELNKNPARFDIAEEVAKASFMMRDYDEAYKYYKNFVETRERFHVSLYDYEDLRIGIVFAKKGLKKEADTLIKNFKAFADSDRTMYKHLHLTYYWAYMHDVPKALKHMKLFSQEDNFSYPVLHLATDPLVDAIRDRPEFKASMKEIERKFNAIHDEIKRNLAEELP